jgi:TPR repeat protein
MQVQVGDIYAAGKGVPIDLVEAFKWYARAADKNWVPAQCKLGDLYASGTGVTKDMDRAIYWYTKAADEDYNEAQRKLVGIITK